ncbi:hypothetical protein AVEN_168630-1 [Araneus ventricosus]|uniref:Uncharacterized protein n=1 Tax=Araneus ventricosus TaxID=182803 RepID=A0A4Y2JBD6_ARAVE|nr:hypothetical protein AVEN_168630-1 [Araneus ventricosus]
MVPVTNDVERLKTLLQSVKGKKQRNQHKKHLWDRIGTKQPVLRKKEQNCYNGCCSKKSTRSQRLAIGFPRTRRPNKRLSRTITRVLQELRPLTSKIAHEIRIGIRLRIQPRPKLLFSRPGSSSPT